MPDRYKLAIAFALLVALQVLAADAVAEREVIDLGDEATLTVYLPERDKATGQAIVVCPGGGYGGLATHTEGTPIGEHLLQRGIAGFVLKYRMPHGLHNVPGDDARAAIRLVRSRAKEWGIDTAKVGIWGFSAGGHLAATLGTVARGDERPDFQILFYPVISMQDDVGHRGSRKNLLGAEPNSELVERYSLDKRVSKSTAPTFLLHASSDKVVDVRNSLRYYEALVASGVDAAMHIYQRGGHGPGAFKQNPSWAANLDEWLKSR